MKYIMIVFMGIMVTSCGQAPGAAESSSGNSDAYCGVGYCYSYLDNVCCPNTAPYACGGYCYSYSGGGGCSSYKTTCY